jgi:hypothetical protein
VIQMADMMLFPKTWEEFEKQYGFYDSKQAYMYGNARLIPSFRVQQWLDHIADIKRKKQLQKNKMEVIANMFGKKLGELFKVRHCYCIGEYTAYFTKDGYMVKTTRDSWKDDSLLVGLILGMSVIVND